MADYHTESRVLLFPHVVGKGSLAACKTRSIDVAVLESFNADRSDQCSDHWYCDDGVRREYGFRTI